MGGCVPYGYEPIKRKLVIKPDEAKAIKFMFEKYLEYKSPLAVSKLMEEAGMKTFARASIDRMLKNPIYMGKIKHQGVLYDGQHEAIVSEEIFKAAQNVVAEKPKKQRT